MGMKKIILVPLLMIISGCHTVGDALNPVTYNSDYRESKNAKGETITHYTKTSLIPNYTTVSYEPSLTTPVSSLEAVPDDPENDFKVLGFLELSQSKDSTHLGLHIGGEPSPYILMRLGVSMFASSDLYWGFDASARAQIPLEYIKPFAGIGGYIGDAEKCYQINSTAQHCDKKFLGAGYGEVGFEVSNFSLFYRKYNLNRAGISIPDQDFIGLGIRFTGGK